MTTETALMESTTQSLPNPTPRPASSPRLVLPWLIPGLGTGVLLWLCFFPLDWGWLAWVALVPLLSLVRLDVSRGCVFWGAYLAGSAFFWPALQWMRVADSRMYATWAMLAVYCSFYFAVAVALIRVLDRRTRLPLVLSVALVWTGLEFVRSFLFTGFAWYFLGHSQHAYLPMIQIADVTGVYGISFLIAAVNAWLFELAYRSDVVRRFLGPVRDVRPVESPLNLGVQGVCLLLLILVCLSYGNMRLAQENFLPGPRLALLQGNLDQRIRNEASGGGVRSMKTIFDYYTVLCERACHTYPQPDLLVWPETSFPYQWVDFPERLDNISRVERDYGEMLFALLREMGRKFKTSHLLGLNSIVLDEQGKGKQYNTALLYPPTGYRGERYDKIHRVPFGEYVPLRDWLPFMNWFAPYDFDYSIRAGEKLTRFKLDKHRFGVLICYEDTDPFLARAYGVKDQDDEPVDFLINISNDGWFDGTSEHEQHLALCRFRAIECRRAVARAVNMGISAVIDSNGRVQKPQQLPELPQFPDCQFWVVEEKRGRIPELPESEWHNFKKAAGVLTATIPIDKRDSVYVRCGDWLPYSCWIGVVAGLVLRRRRPVAS